MIPVASELTTTGISGYHRSDAESSLAAVDEIMLSKGRSGGDGDITDMEVELEQSSLDHALTNDRNSITHLETRDAVPTSLLASSGSSQNQKLSQELQEHAMEEMQTLNYTAAEELFRYILHLQHEQHESDEHIVSTLASIGKCCEATGRLEEAMSCYKEALLVKENKDLRHEPQSIQMLMAGILYSIGMIHCQFLSEGSRNDDDSSSSSSEEEGMEQEQQPPKKKLAYTKALKAFTMSLKLRKACLGNDHPTVSTTQFNIANLLTESGMPDDAMEFHLQALEARRKVLGSHHPDVASSLRHIAITYTALGKYQDAETALTGALEILKKIPFDGSLQQVMIELSNVKRKLLRWIS